MYKCYITKLKNVRKHPNADRLFLADCFDCTVVVGQDYQEGEIVCYFPTDGQISEKFARINKLTRDLGGFFEKNRRVRTQKFRGEISDGFACRLDLLENVAGKEAVATLKVGDRFSELNGIKICQKYYAKATYAARSSNSKKRLRGETQFFPKHEDTEQLSYYVHKLKVGDPLVITNKYHGTSHRIGYVLDENPLKSWQQFINKFVPIFPTQSYQLMSGTRNVILNDDKTVVNDNIRRDTTEYFRNKLNKNELLFFEIVGWDGETPIMPPHDTKQLKDKDFTARYGDKMFYNYGCAKGIFQLYLYRVAYVNPDGLIYDLTWDQVKRRAEELGIKTPHEYARLTYDGDADDLIKLVNDYADREDPSGEHWSEGCCVRIDSSKVKTYKLKNIRFKILEGIVKNNDDYVDVEEAS